jgi:hypothetical protein
MCIAYFSLNSHFEKKINKYCFHVSHIFAAVHQKMHATLTNFLPFPMLISAVSVTDSGNMLAHTAHRLHCVMTGNLYATLAYLPSGPSIQQVTAAPFSATLSWCTPHK